MKFFLIAATLLPAVLGLTINTPTNVVQCQPILLTYGSGTPPYYVSAIPGGQVSAAALRSWVPTNAESLTWNVDIASGTSVSFLLKDSTGAQAFSDAVVIQSSSDSSCLNGSSSAGATHASSEGAAPATVAGSNTQGPSQSLAAASPARTTAVQGASTSNTVTRTSGGERQSKRSVAPWVAVMAGIVGVLAL